MMQNASIQRFITWSFSVTVTASLIVGGSSSKLMPARYLWSVLEVV
jgi:hypothetical protein